VENLFHRKKIKNQGFPQLVEKVVENCEKRVENRLSVSGLRLWKVDFEGK